MTHQELQAQLQPYLDGELDAAQRRSVDEHLKGCPACRRELENLQILHSALQSPELRYKASDTLKQRIQMKLREADARERRPKWPVWAAAAALTLVAVAVTWSFLPRGGENEEDAMVDAVVDQQEHASEAGHFTDIASSDAAAIKSWFSGKLAYTPPVPDLSGQGYALVGARLEKVEDQPAAALTYRRGNEDVTVFVCAAEKPGESDLDTDTDDGYHVVYWTKGSLSFWVVSKLDPAALKQLGESVRQAV